MRQPLSGTFRKGQETLKKKAKELSTLCDIPVCAVIVSPEGTTESWPDSQSDVKNIFDVYKKKIPILGQHDRCKTDDVQFTEIDDDYDEIMEGLNSKIIAIERRIMFLEGNEREKISRFEIDLIRV